MALFKKDKLVQLLEEQTARELARSHHILLVDDEPDNLRVLTDLLSEEYFIHTAQGGPEALKVLKTQPVDLILSDQRMPEMTGVEFLCKTIHTMPYTIRIILTGYTDVDAIIMAINEGRVYRYLTKPWDTREMRITIRRAIEAYESERRNRRKSEFLARTSHELRTPLNAIIGYSEMLEEQAAELGQNDTIADLRKINTAAQHVLGLVNELLDLSKIEAGKMQLFPETFEIAPMIEGVAVLIAPLAEKKGNRLEVRTEEGLGSMRTDLVKLRQCLFNLLSNASKFTEGGVLSLEASRETTKGREWIVFQISDSGVGLTEEQVGRLFQPYEQAEKSTSAKFGGTGLGLAITKQFVLLMEGAITVKSKPGEGTTFTVKLPVLLSEEPATPKVPPMDAPPLPLVN